jgi:hypothetical protein
MTKRIFPPLSLLLALAFIVCPQPAFAYLDPGTGNFIFQLLIGGAIGALATIKIWWAKVVAWLKPKKN